MRRKKRNRSLGRHELDEGAKHLQGEIRSYGPAGRSYVLSPHVLNSVSHYEMQSGIFTRDLE